MINFSSDDIKTKSSEWSLNDDVKLLNKLKQLDELFSAQTKEILNNVNQTDNTISNEIISVKNLINDFYLIGQKQFTENRVEEENEIKSLKLTDNEESSNSFNQSNDPDKLIHDRMKLALDNSLNFVDKKMKILNQNEDKQNLNETLLKSNRLNDQLEILIKNSKYFQKTLPPIVNSEQFNNEVFNLVKQSTTATNIQRKKVYSSSSLNESKTESSSIISDLENISINEKILEINEQNFIENLSTSTQRSSISFDEVTKKEISQPPNLKTLSTHTVTGKNESLNELDQSQTFKADEIKISNEIVNSVQKLDSIFGKASISTKNRLFDEDDSDDELFQPSKIEKRLSKDLFKSDSSIDSIRATSSNLFDSDIKSTSESVNKSIIKPTTQSSIKSTNIESFNKSTSETVVNTTENIQTKQTSGIKKNILDKLFESDSDDDDQLFSISTRSSVKVRPEPKIVIDQQNKKLIKSEPEKEIKPISEVKLLKEEIKPNKKSNFIEQQIKQIEKPTPEVVLKKQVSIEKEEKESKNFSTIKDKMPNKKELFKNQLEDLFAKKRNPNQGLIKVNKDQETLSDNEKDKENSDSTRRISVTSINKSSSTNDIKSNQYIPRKEFDPFNSSNDLFSQDLIPINTSTLDNNLVKSRVKPNNRKRPTKGKSNVQPNLEKLNKQSSNSSSISNILSKDTDEDISEKLIVKDVIDNKPNEIKAEKTVEDNKPINETTKRTLFLNDSSDEDSNDLRKNTIKTLNESLDRRFKTLFDSDDDDSLFTSPTKKISNKDSIKTNDLKIDSKLNHEKEIKKDELKRPIEKVIEKQEEKPKPSTVKKVNSIFDSDSDDDELFLKK